jgi:4a-hydroxytetrahydrobiopterin dehydratase
MENWNEKDNTLVKKFEFTTFEKAIAWMQACVPHIAELDHHPEWQNVYNSVSVRLTTHSAGNTITEKDHKLASILDEIYCQVL